MRTSVFSKKCILYVAATFILCWSLAGVFHFAGGNWNSPAAYVVAVVYMFIPSLVTIILQKFVFHDEILQKYDVRLRWNSWVVLAWLLPAGIAILAFLVSLLIPDVSFSPTMEGMYERFSSVMGEEELESIRSDMARFPIHPFWMAIVQALIAGITINAVAGFGEELGWRGLMLDELNHLSFWHASLVIGVIWGLWHAPLILMGHNYPQHPVVGVPMMVAWTLLLSVLITYVRIKAATLLSAAIMHGSINASAGLAIILVVGGNDLSVGLTGLAGFLALAVAIAGLVFYDTRLARTSVLRAATVNEAMSNSLKDRDS